MLRKHIPHLIASLVVTQAAGLVGAFFTAQSVTNWYGGLAKPVLAPPDWVFGPVWTILYLLIGTALFLVWTRHLGGRTRSLWLKLFFIQLALNTLWSYLFFGLRRPDIALFELGVLWLSIAALIVLALKFDKRAAALLLPYLFWVSFAGYLNFEIWRLN